MPLNACFIESKHTPKRREKKNMVIFSSLTEKTKQNFEKKVKSRATLTKGKKRRGYSSQSERS